MTRIRDNNNVFVELKDGIEIPYPARELVPVDRELIIGQGVENIDLDVSSGAMRETLYFIIEPDSEKAALAANFNLILFNATTYNIKYVYSVKEKELSQVISQGDAGPMQKVMLKRVRPQFFSEYDSHSFEALFYKHTIFDSHSPVSKKLLVTTDILQKSEPILHSEFRFPVYGYVLKDDFSPVKPHTHNAESKREYKAESSRNRTEQFNRPNSSKAYQKSLVKEVDLHIEELVDSTKGLSNFEMLRIQLEKFSRELDAAIAGHIKKIIFIHGVGNGRLKHEIVTALKKVEGISFHDAAYKEYGFGATQVNIH